MPPVATSALGAPVLLWVTNSPISISFCIKQSELEEPWPQRAPSPVWVPKAPRCRAGSIPALHGADVPPGPRGTLQIAGITSCLPRASSRMLSLSASGVNSPRCCHSWPAPDSGAAERWRWLCVISGLQRDRPSLQQPRALHREARRLQRRKIAL